MEMMENLFKGNGVQKIPSFADVSRSVIGRADCQPAHTFFSFLPLSYFFPNFFFSSFLVLSFYSLFFSFLFFLSCLSLSFFLSCVGVPVLCMPGVPASSRIFFLFLLFYPYVFVCYPYFAGMYSYVTRMYSYVVVWCSSHDPLKTAV